MKHNFLFSQYLLRKFYEISLFRSSISFIHSLSYKHFLFILAIVSFTGIASCKKKSELPRFPLGGNFTLTDHDGKKFSLSESKGKAVLLFFGYTNCPDACPTILSRLKNLLKNKNIDSGKIKILFVSVDPERDRPEKLKNYLEYYNIGAIGLTGNINEIAAAAKLFGVYYNKRIIDSKTLYAVDHTTTLFVLDTNGDVRHLFRYADDERVLVPVLKLILENAN